MKAYLSIVLGLTIILFSCTTKSAKLKEETVNIPSSDHNDENLIAIVIHGGAGAIKKELMPDSLEQVYLHFLDSVLHLGYELLENGEEAIDAVTLVISTLEDSPLFNAGKGAVFTHDETNELDASIMDGKTKNAGAAAGVRAVKNPILLAKGIMEKSEHVMMSGKGADDYAQKLGLEIVSPEYFRVENRLKSLKKVKERAKEKQNKTSFYDEYLKNEKFGTVGCVALDKNGNIVAGTSTGGMTNKRWGRIGDSPIIGAGTYADNTVCGISATGWGEFFIRGVVAYDIAALMNYKGLSLTAAANEVIHKKVPDMGGDGGIIGLDSKGNIALIFNTSGMYRAAIDGQGNKTVAIYE